jgi:hypothetical protein
MMLGGVCFAGSFCSLPLPPEVRMVELVSTNTVGKVRKKRVCLNGQHRLGKDSSVASTTREFPLRT